MCNQVSTTTLKFFDKPTKETHRGSLWKPVSCEGHLPHSKPSRATFLKDEVLKRENNKLWLGPRNWGTGEGYIGTSTTIISGSVQILYFKERPMCKEGKLEGERFNFLLQPRILEWWDSLTDVYEEFKGKLLQLYYNPPLTSHSPQLQLHKARSHHSTCMPLGSTLGRPPAFLRRQILCLESVQQYALPSWVHFISACPCWRVHRLLSAASPEKYQAGHTICTTERFSRKKRILKHSYFGQLWIVSLWTGRIT